MSYDIVIRDGTIVDGSGLPRYRADVAINNGRIAKIGKITEGAEEVIDAEGHVVAPGFIDGHTHMDAQIFWDRQGTCSCWHGVTTVVMGNCGFSLAPCAEKDKLMVMRNLERAEDISPAAMEAGIKWSWDSFPQYLDAIDSLPKGINYTAYMGHSALRTYVMGQRAFTEEATSEDIAAMKRELRTAIKAGAAGFSTSRNRNHQTPDSQPVASRLANWNEVRELVGVMGELGAGVFELAQEDIERDPEKMRDFMGRLQRLALETRVPTTFGVIYSRKAPHTWRPYFKMIDETVAAGGRMLAQGTSRWISSLLSFETAMPFDKAPVWSDIRKLPLAEQEAALRNPETRAKLLEVAREMMTRPERAVGAEARKPDFDYLYVLEKPLPPYRTIAEVAKERNQDPLEVIIDLALEKHLKQFFIQPIVNEDQDVVLGMMRHPRQVVTFSDSGAHVSQIMDSSIQTHLLGHWVRERQALTLEQAVRKISFDLASFWGLEGRGMLAEGNHADVVVFDPNTIAPTMPTLEYDLPGGARRLKQKSVGIKTTIVNGEVTLRNNEATGALPGRLIRGPLAANA
ncbi:MAG TPA: amidohydrolase family protein [Candidatus Binataceae bacterium]|nr:amidohydrolase family protein [Candidatus Binataceae bacterium]